MKNDADIHIITSVCTGIYACKYGIKPTMIVTTDKTCYRAVIEQSSFLWFNFVGEIMYPQWSPVQEMTYSCNIVKGMEQNYFLA